jgi:hypothetical protein
MQPLTQRRSPASLDNSAKRYKTIAILHCCNAEMRQKMACPRVVIMGY